ncbi:MAG: PD-(D/E)XK nuclease family protein [Pseudomonadota bacterium]
MRAVRRRRPRAWAELFDTVLAALGWPGKRSRGSMDYQLENRFRELLGELGRLELIQADMTLGDAIGRLVALSRDTVFQPEAGDTRVDVLGPLEAAGQDFDALWIAGMTSADWPPPGRPSPLLSRDLQQRYDMPDASPDDTVNQAARLLDRLLGSSAEAVVSYPAVIGDAEQMPTALLGEATVEDGGGDPGFYATTLLGSRSYEFFDDPAPPVAKDERIAGGARTLDLQTRDPFAAFAVGRLGIRLLRPFRPGIGADVRGNLIHDALRALYSDLPTRGELAGWPADERAERARLATQAAFTPMFRHADDTLKQLLRLEEQRARMLIESVLRLDAGRDDFSLAAVEQRLDSRIGPLLLSLRTDRVDRLADDSLVILDYKTSRTQTFQTGGVPNDLQLPVYALAVDAPVAGLGLFRVDSAVIEIDGVGPGLGQDTDWDSALGAWRETVLAAALRFADGDARVNVRQAARDARPLSLLSRYAESVRNV